ncbi:MAG TPA: prepilin-type N-terminal cleavage/methylation domain-containing protein, partial [Verrucomicrobiae bacterium]
MLKSKTMIARRARKKVLAFSLQPSAVACAGFTMVEIAISLAIIGIALVAILGVLPIGLRMQRDNREQTVINQDATIFMEAIRGGARGLDDLTNYVYAITNYWTIYSGGSTVKNGVNGYSYAGSSTT